MREYLKEKNFYINIIYFIFLYKYEGWQYPYKGNIVTVVRKEKERREQKKGNYDIFYL